VSAFAVVNLSASGAGSGVESDGLGQTSLPFVEAPKALRPQLQRTGHVQRIECAEAEGGAISPGEIDVGFPCSMGKLYRSPQAREVVAPEFSPYFLRFNESEPLQKDLLINSVCQLRVVEGRNPDGEAESHALINARRVRIRDVARSTA